MSLDLDERQRAMLHEMGVHVWWPAPTVAASESMAVAPGAVVPQAVPVRVVHDPAPALKGPTRSPEAIESIAVGAMDWTALTQAVANCQACALANGRRAPVFGAADVPPRADWLLVGEPPDEAEERLGSPFADAAGQLLDNMLKAVGVSRRSGSDPAASAYVTNAVKCRPAQVRNPQAQELAVCEHYLRREVALVRPKVILAMGRFAAQALLQASHPELISTPLGKLRGRVYYYQGIAVVVTYHPGYLLRSQQDKARAWADLCLALAQSQA